MNQVIDKPQEVNLAKQSNGTIRDLLQKQKQQIALALPGHLNADRMMRVALTTINKNPKLASCTQASLLACIMDCAALGLEPDNRRAHLIPYGDKCTLIIDYKGLVELMMRTGQVSSIHSDVVCENDVFSYNLGIVETHKIDFRQPRGEMYAAYVIITFKDGSKKCEVMTREEIDSIRKRSRAGKDGPWVTDYHEMAKKTVFRRASKWVPLSAELQETLERDGDVLDVHAEKIVDIKKPLFSKPDEAIDLPNEATEESPLPSSDGMKTREFNRICQDQKLGLGEVLNHLGELGYPSFEEVPDNVFEAIRKNPAAFAKKIQATK